MLGNFAEELIIGPLTRQRCGARLLLLDSYTDEVQKLIEAKAKGQKREAPAPKAAKGNVIDLVAALQESLGSVKKGKKTLCGIEHAGMVNVGSGRRMSASQNAR